MKCTQKGNPSSVKLSKLNKGDTFVSRNKVTEKEEVYMLSYLDDSKPSDVICKYVVINLMTGDCHTWTTEAVEVCEGYPVDAECHWRFKS